jgi:hypothetical protein
VDYQGPNQITKKNHYPLPLIGKETDRLSSAKSFTKLDIHDAYHRVRTWEGNEWKTAFQTRYGQFEYSVITFSPANAQAAFQGYVNHVLHTCFDLHCKAYLDNIVIYWDNCEEHTAHVRTVLERLKTACLYVKLLKCQFYAKRTGFVGLIITPDGVKMKQDQMRTIFDWPTP